jgi:hypothetical protein
MRHDIAKEVRRSDAGTLAAYLGGAARDGTYSHLHPSRRIDPNYWRIFVRANSHLSFAERVGSWPPQKREVFRSLRLRGVGAAPEYLASPSERSHDASVGGMGSHPPG